VTSFACINTIDPRVDDPHDEFHGPYYEYFEDRIILAGQYDHDKKTGSFQAVHTTPAESRDGSDVAHVATYGGKDYCPSSFGEYLNDRKHGDWYEYNSECRMTLHAKFDNGITVEAELTSWALDAHGKWMGMKTKDRFDDRGNQISSTLYHPLSNKRIKQRDVDVNAGIVVERGWFANKPEAKSYVKYMCQEQKCKMHESWYPNGKLSFECMYESGVPTGKCRGWNENGTLHWVIRFTSNNSGPVVHGSGTHEAPELTSNFVKVPFRYDGVQLPGVIAEQVQSKEHAFTHAKLYRADGTLLFEASRTKGLTEYKWWRGRVMYAYLHLPDSAYIDQATPPCESCAYEQRVNAKGGPLKYIPLKAGPSDSSRDPYGWNRAQRHGCVVVSHAEDKTPQYVVYNMNVEVCTARGDDTDYCPSGCNTELLK